MLETKSKKAIRYPKDVKAEAVALAKKIGTPKAAEQLGIPYNSVNNWCNKEKARKKVEPVRIAESTQAHPHPQPVKVETTPFLIEPVKPQDEPQLSLQAQDILTNIARRERQVYEPVIQIQEENERLKKEVKRLMGINREKEEQIYILRKAAYMFALKIDDAELQTIMDNGGPFTAEASF